MLYTQSQGLNLHLEIELMVTRAENPADLNSDQAETSYIEASGPIRVKGGLDPKNLLPTLNRMRMAIDDMAEMAYEIVMTLACEGLKGDALECRKRYQPVLAGWIDNISHVEGRQEEADNAGRFLADMLAYDINAQCEAEMAE